MIIELLLTAFYNIMSFLLSPINIPSMPSEVSGYLADFLEYIAIAKEILACYTPLGYLLTLFGIVVVIETSILIYHFVMWVLKKIPMVNIK